VHHHRTARTAALALAIAALSAPSAIAQADAPSPDPVGAGQELQDKRSPDAIDAASTAETTPQDKRSPDARDAAEGRGASTSPEVVVVKLTDPAPADGFDWADAAVGAGALLGLLLLGLGGALVLMHHRRGRPQQASDVSHSRRVRGLGRVSGRRRARSTTRSSHPKLEITDLAPDPATVEAVPGRPDASTAKR
jgi:hypothetical protein